MLLKYVPFLELNAGHISSLDFSKCGRILAVVNTVGEIRLCDTKTGVCYNPVLNSGTTGGSSTLWIGDTVLTCGLSDGSLATCNVMNGRTSGQHQVDLSKEQVTDKPINSLSYHPTTKMLAIGSSTKVRLYTNGDAVTDWQYHDRLPELCTSGKGQTFPVEVVAVAWLLHSKGELLVSYKYHGITIWDATHEVEILKTFNYWDVICTGILCYTPHNIFIGINDEHKVVLYNLDQGLRWALPHLDNIVSVCPIHRNTGFVVGGQEVAQLVDIPLRMVTQVLRQDSYSPPLEAIHAACAHHDVMEENFMIATATGTRCMIWKTVVVGTAI